MKVFFVAVFDDENKSTNNSQARSFERLGHEVYRYSFRDRGTALGESNRDLELLDVVKSVNPDLVVFSKCAEISLQAITEICESYKTCYWYMDPLTSLRDDYLQKARQCSFAVSAVPNTVPKFEAINKNTFLVYEGFDSDIDSPFEMEKQLDVSFIGSLHSQRKEMLTNLDPNVANITGAFGTNHAKAVSASKININVSTSGGASDRVFKVLAAGGFLLSTDWVGREEMFSDGEHLVIYSDKKDLQEKITHYLNNKDERDRIALNGLNAVQKYSRDEWAKQIILISKGLD
tara:strand:- start:1454 stop:2323 length:870 start_codon:yes stop_codon:yes gene_type:complete